MQFIKYAIIKITTLLLLVLALAVPAMAAETISEKLSLGERRQAALQYARDGKFDVAIPALMTLVKDAPKDVGIKADYIVILTWAKKDREALAEASGMDAKAIPNYCLNALAKAARNTSQYSTAIAYYEQLILLEPSNLDSVLGKVLVLIDTEKFVDAESLLMKLRHQHPNNVDVLRAVSYLGQQSKQPVMVIDANTRLLVLNHQDLDAVRALVKATREAGAIQQALKLAEQYPNVINQDEIDKINNDSAANYISWGHYSPKNPSERFADTDKALVKLDEACKCDWNKLDLKSGINQNLIFDRMLALRDRYRMQEVITHYQYLLHSNVDMPAYVLNAAGDAYLYKRMPEQAIKIYDASLAKVPDNNETKFSKFYALVELERFEDARTLIENLSINTAAYRQRPKNPVIRADENKLIIDSKSFYLSAYGDDLASAERQFQALNNIGPMSNDVRMALGEIWRWRGWAELAEKRFSEIGQDYPDLLIAKINLAETLLDLQDWQVAENLILPIVKEYPENASVQALERRWLLHNKRQFSLDGFSSQSSGSTFGSRTQGLNAVLYSSPINYNYRAFASAKYNHATFVEGSGNVSYPGVGVEYTKRDWRLTGEISQASLSKIGVTAAVTADYRLNDHWSFATSLEANSTQMPLRGLKTGVSGDLLSANTQYRWSDLTRASAGVGYLNVSDGNHRKSLNLQFDRRLITQPHYKLTTHLRVDASSNSKNDAIYFNPERDLDTSIVLDNEWILWRRYDRSFNHRLQVGAGNYWQKNFGSDSTWMVSYEQGFKLDDSFEVNYGITRSRHPYDGTNEYSTQFFTRLNLLF